MALSLSLLLLSVTLSVKDVVCENPISISSRPLNGIIAKGGTAVISCSLAPTWQHSTIIWTQKFGSRRVELAQSTILDSAFRELNNKYMILQTSSRTPEGQIVTSYELSIKDAGYEDISEISCSISGKTPVGINIAVCENGKFSSEWCQCVSRNGWNNPDCLEKPGDMKKMEDSYKKSITGLAVCLGIVIVYAIVASIVVGWDCMMKMHAKRQKAMDAMKARAAAARNRPTYDDGEREPIDINDSRSSIEYPSKLPRNPEIEKQFREYERLQANSAVAQTHVNAGYRDDDQYEKLSPRPNGNVHSSGGVDTRATYGQPNYDMRENGDVRPKYPQTNMLPAERQYGRRAAERSPGIPQAGKSPGDWSTHSAQTPYIQEHAHADTRQAYSERPPPRQGDYERHSAPRRLDFADSKQRYTNTEDLSKAYIDQSDTVV